MKKRKNKSMVELIQEMDKEFKTMKKIIMKDFNEAIKCLNKISRGSK